MERHPCKQQLSPIASAFLPATMQGQKKAVAQIPMSSKQPHTPLDQSLIFFLLFFFLVFCFFFPPSACGEVANDDFSGLVSRRYSNNYRECYSVYAVAEVVSKTKPLIGLGDIGAVLQSPLSKIPKIFYYELEQ
jgi:hypothetical protein